MFCFSNTGHVIVVNSQENCFFQISSYSRACVRIIYKKDRGVFTVSLLLADLRSDKIFVFLRRQESRDWWQGVFYFVI